MMDHPTDGRGARFVVVCAGDDIQTNETSWDKDS